MSARRRLLAPLLVAAVAACRWGNAPAPAPESPSPAEAGDVQAARVPVPPPGLGYDAREGRVLFAHYCSTCHGAEGRGDGFNAYTLDPKPRDLSDRSFQAARSDAELASVIRSGGPAAGLSTGMPPWGRVLSQRRIAELVIYLRTLQPEEQ